MNKLIKLIPWKIRKPIRDLLRGKTIEEVDIIFNIFEQEHHQNRTMVDVGAHFGTALMPFLKKGWKVYGLEPDAANRKKLVAATSSFSNIVIDTRAASDKSDEVVSFFTSEVSTGISGMSSFHKSHVETAKVKTIRLSDFCQEKEIQHIDFLKIDTEGFDLFVLKGFDWKTQKHPDYIICEFEDRKTKPLGYTFQEQAQFLIDNGYQVLISEWHPIIEYGSTHKWKRFVKNPKQVNDELAWGNILAAKPENFSKIIQQAKKIKSIE